jgi:arylsulfatase A-like enzyme
VRKRRLAYVIAAVILGSAGVAAWTFLPERPTPGSGKKNLIIISIDTLRVDHLGCYGYPRSVSPAVDALASQGVRFQRAAAQSPWTLPSHVSLLTGLYPHRHGVTTSQSKLAGSVPTLAGILAQHGYVTGALTSSEWLTERQGFNSGFRKLEYFPEISGSKLVNTGKPVTDRALRWIRENDAHPFFLFIHYYDVHSDYAPDEPYRSMFVDPRYGGLVDGSTAQLLQVRKGARHLNKEDVKRLVDLYDGEIRQLDDQIRRLLDFLDRRGRSGDTYVVFTADHGEEFMEHGSVLHGRTMFEEVIAVPLIVRGPGVPSGVSVPSLVQLIDVVPTVMTLLGIPPGVDLDGINLQAYWRSGSQPPDDRFVFAEADWQNAQPDIKRMVRNARYKLVFDRLSQARLLYDLKEDPGEHRDIAANHRELAEAMMRMLRTFMSGGREGERVGPPSEETRKRLESLGYL